MAKKNGIIWNIFREIREAIDKTASPVPVKIEDSKLIKELDRIEKKYLNNGGEVNGL